MEDWRKFGDPQKFTKFFKLKDLLIDFHLNKQKINSVT